MKVALLTSGQPRFTQCFTKLQSQLLGFEKADIYMCLWASEHILGTYLYENGQPLVLGNFKSHLAGAMGSEIQGRSKYTDKHFHLPFLQDPTE